VAKSKARKFRDKLEREGKRNPEWNRQTWIGLNPVERKPQRPIIEMRRKEQKYKPNHLHAEDHSVYLFLGNLALINFRHSKV
jgi:hypothetical protein